MKLKEKAHRVNSKLIAGFSTSHYIIQINRNNIWKQTIENFKNKPKGTLVGGIYRAQFLGELGYDSDSLVQDWMINVIKAMVKEEL